jgi:hypothetical protein
MRGLARADVLAAGRCFADALQVLYILVQFMCIQVCSLTHALGRAMSQPGPIVLNGDDLGQVSSIIPKLSVWPCVCV